MKSGLEVEAGAQCQENPREMVALRLHGPHGMGLIIEKAKFALSGCVDR
jgi:hypothetical protein